jgi:hypothetical protein
VGESRVESSDVEVDLSSWDSTFRVAATLVGIHCPLSIKHCRIHHCNSRDCQCCRKRLVSQTLAIDPTMSPASPSPTSPGTKPRTRQRMKRFFRGLLRPSSQKASASTMTLDVYQQDADNERGLVIFLCQSHNAHRNLGSQPRASLNDLRTHGELTCSRYPSNPSNRIC